MWLKTSLTDHNWALLFTFCLLNAPLCFTLWITTIKSKCFFFQFPRQKTVICRCENVASSKISDGQNLQDSPHTWTGISRVTLVWRETGGLIVHNSSRGINNAFVNFIRHFLWREAERKCLCHAWGVRLLKTWSWGKYWLGWQTVHSKERKWAGDGPEFWQEPYESCGSCGVQGLQSALRI